MIHTCAEGSGFFTQHKPDLCTLFNKMFEQRSCLHHASLKSLQIFFIRAAWQTRIENDCDSSFVLGSEFTDR